MQIKTIIEWHFIEESIFSNTEKLFCPQCKIAGMYVKDSQRERLLVYITQGGTVVPKYSETSAEGFDFTEVYCLGCSWHDSPKQLTKT